MIQSTTAEYPWSSSAHNPAKETIHWCLQEAKTLSKTLTHALTQQKAQSQCSRSNIQHQKLTR